MRTPQLDDAAVAVRRRPEEEGAPVLVQPAVSRIVVMTHRAWPGGRSASDRLELAPHAQRTAAAALRANASDEDRLISTSMTIAQPTNHALTTYSNTRVGYAVAVSETTVYSVPGMHCPHCERAVRDEVSTVRGVTAVEVDLDRKLVTVAGELLDDVAVRAAIEAAGYDVI